ncbi:GNAT family N-acetyltransferase [Paenibacillus sp. GYB003]|uniref:GNAT family N-acetyltransferase n=1 Tax=Paenibacillus sp. GYB003 TaxID=2994392 RepID=UPI002F963C46
MDVVNATKEDIQGWLELAAEVEYLFGPMLDNPHFIDALEKNINRGSAYCVRENNGSPGSNLLGGVLFSSSNAPFYKIGWLSVSSQSRGRGVATVLLNHVLSLVRPSSEVSVITFGDDIPDGKAARSLYQKFGFIPSNELVPNGPEGGSRQKFILTIPDRGTKAIRRLR